METEKIKTENRLTIMEQKIDNLIKSVDNVGKNLDKVDLKLDKHVQMEAEKYEKLDNKYSGKWVETGVVSIITALVIASLIGLATYFFKN